MFKNDQSKYYKLAKKLSDQFKTHSSVEAIAIGGSHQSDNIDSNSDVDLYIFTSNIIPLAFRENVVNKMGASKVNLNLNFWDIGDLWIDQKTEIEIDVMFWDQKWIEMQLEQVLVHNQAKLGYTTCFWHTIKHSKILFERKDWFKQLQLKCRQPFSQKLRNAIISKNHPVLRNIITSYYHQIKKAINRKDLISVNHRVSALLASYFDVLFAINYQTHPGEKRLLTFALKKCQKLPNGFEKQIEDVLKTSGDEINKLLTKVDLLLENLDKLLLVENIDPSTTLSFN